MHVVSMQQQKTGLIVRCRASQWRWWRGGLLLHQVYLDFALVPKPGKFVFGKKANVSDEHRVVGLADGSQVCPCARCLLGIDQDGLQQPDHKHVALCL